MNTVIVLHCMVVILGPDKHKMKKLCHFFIKINVSFGFHRLLYIKKLLGSYKYIYRMDV